MEYRYSKLQGLSDVDRELTDEEVEYYVNLIKEEMVESVKEYMMVEGIKDYGDLKFVIQDMGKIEMYFKRYEFYFEFNYYVFYNKQSSPVDLIFSLNIPVGLFDLQCDMNHLIGNLSKISWDLNRNDGYNNYNMFIPKEKILMGYSQERVKMGLPINLDSPYILNGIDDDFQFLLKYLNCEVEDDNDNLTQAVDTVARAMHGNPDMGREAKSNLEVYDGSRVSITECNLSDKRFVNEDGEKFFTCKISYYLHLDKNEALELPSDGLDLKLDVKLPVTCDEEKFKRRANRLFKRLSSRYNYGEYTWEEW